MLNRNLVIKASAGSGKTTRLVKRYIELLISGVQPEIILATTFTKKAAGEISSRIFYTLAAKLSNYQNLQHLISENVKISEVERAFNQLISNQHRLNIGTLDSLFYSMLRMITFELGINPNWTVTYNQKLFFGQALSKVIQSNDPLAITELYKHINFSKQNSSFLKLISNEHASILCLVNSTELSNWDTLACKLPFNDEQLLVLKASIPNIVIPKSKSGEQNKNWARQIESINNSIISNDWWSFIQLGLIQKILNNEQTYYNVSISDEVKVILQPFIKQARAKILNDINNSNKAYKAIVTAISEELLNIRNQQGAFTFDDIKQRLIKYVNLDNLNTLYFRLDQKFKHILLDEFQDTSVDEYLLLKPILAEAISAVNSDGSLFCVGDEKQAIYGWRGGDAELLNQLINSYSDIKVEALNQTRRCSKAIIGFVNKVFENLSTNMVLKNYPEVLKKWKNNFTLHNTANHQAGKVEVLNYSENPSSSVIDLIGKIRQTDRNGSIGILTFENEKVVELVQALKLEKIECSEEGGNPIVNFPQVALILSILKLIDCPDDTIARFHIENSKFCSYLEQIDSFQAQQELLEVGISNFIANLVIKYNLHSDYALKKLVNLAYEYQQSVRTSSYRFIDYLANQKLEDPKTSLIRVMTIHKSKGLEFDHVILPELDQPIVRSRRGILAERNSPDGPPTRVTRWVGEKIRIIDPWLTKIHNRQIESDICESLSVLYVALTRAKAGLYLLIKEEDTNQKTFASLLDCRSASLAGTQA